MTIHHQRQIVDAKDHIAQALAIVRTLDTSEGRRPPAEGTDLSDAVRGLMFAQDALDGDLFDIAGAIPARTLT